MIVRILIALGRTRGWRGLAERSLLAQAVRWEKSSDTGVKTAV